MKTYDPTNPQHRRDLATALREALVKAKFSVVRIKGTKEEVHAYPTSNPQIRILVYTTIVGNEVRQTGKDALRVALVYKNEAGDERGMAKETRVNRTGEIDGIVERMFNRVHKVHDAGKQVVKCPHCGAPTFTSKIRKDPQTGATKGGNQVCMELCWKKPKPEPKRTPVQATGTDGQPVRRERPAEPAIRDYADVPF